MLLLWTFEDKPKLEQFTAVLEEEGIVFEVGKPKSAINELTVSVEDRDYREAKKLLAKHKKRRTLREHTPGHRG